VYPKVENNRCRLRKSSKVSQIFSKSIEFAEFRVDPVRRELHRNGALVHLTPKVFDTLLLLVENAGEVVTKEDLLKQLWPDSVVEESNLTQNIFVLRKALGASEVAPYVQTVPRVGYRFIADIRLGEPAAQPPPPVRRRLSPWIAMVAGLLMLSAASTAWWLLRGPGRTAEIRSVAVLPFRNLSGNSQDEYLADSLTELLTSSLAKGGFPRVISRTSSMQFRSSGKKLPEIAREMRVDGVIEGSVARSGDRVRVSAQLIHALTDHQIWSEVYDRDMKDLPDLQLDIARTIARQAGLAVNPAAKTSRPPGRAAFEEYLRGRHAWNKRSPAGIKAAIQHFQNAIDLDAAYAAPYAGLADAYNQLGTHLIGERPASETRPLAVAAARRAIEIDDTLAEAHAALGYAKNYDWDWAGAGRELRRAIELNPSYGSAHIWYASWFEQQGRHPEAVAQARAALDLDPLSLIVRTQVGWTYQHGGELDKAIPYFRDVLEKDPNYLWALWQLGEAYIQMGRHQEAVAVLERAAERSQRTPAILGTLGAAYALAGRRSAAEAILLELADLSKRRYVSPHAFTWTYLGLGDADRGFEWLEREYQDRSNSVAWIGVWHLLDKHRSDPRYLDMMRRIGLGRND